MSTVYATILDVLTTGLYNEIKYAVREYIQNSYDAIKMAKNEKLPEPKDGYYISVDISKDNKVITIFDNGIGMTKKILEDYTSIGGGTKNNTDFTGYKGIGKLSGLRFFRTFIVRTKTADSDVGYELKWESGQMMEEVVYEREIIKKIPYQDFIKRFVEIKPFKDKKGSHYTQVQLINVAKDRQGEVSEEKIKDFIRKTCPIVFDKSKFEYADTLRTYLYTEFPFVKILVNDKQVYQYYNDEYELVEPYRCYVKYANFDRAKIWISWIHNSAENIPYDEIRGIKFRCKGIVIGDSNLFIKNCMPPGRGFLANWFTGEVIVLDEQIKPNSARDGFCEGEESRTFYEELEKQIGKGVLENIAKTRSELMSATKELEVIKGNIKDKQEPAPGMIARITDRLKVLEKSKSQTGYGLNFKIADELKQLVKKASAIKETPKTLIAIPKVSSHIQTPKTLDYEAIVFDIICKYLRTRKILMQHKQLKEFISSELKRRKIY